MCVCVCIKLSGFPGDRVKSEWEDEVNGHIHLIPLYTDLLQSKSFVLFL